MVTTGFAKVEAAVGLARPVVGVQAYVMPATAEKPITAPFGFWLVAHVLVKSAPALTAGTVKFTLNTIDEVAVHPLDWSVAVST